MGSAPEARSAPARGRAAQVAWLLSSLLALAAYDVHHREDDDPDRVHEVPVPRNHLDVLRMCLAHLAGEAESQDKGEQDHAHDHVRGMEADERVERGTEYVRSDRQVV